MCFQTSSASVLVNKKRSQKKASSGRRNQETEDLPENVETARNRLTTRALYDTEEEVCIHVRELCSFIALYMST